MLQEPNICFYAGYPLTVNSHKLGTLCIIEQTPRDFDEEDVQLLKNLTAMVVRELTTIQIVTMD